jgi:hypothetical protein
MTESQTARDRLTKSLEDLDINSDTVYHIPEGTFVFVDDPLEAQRLRDFFQREGRNSSFSISPNYVPEQFIENWDLGIDMRGAFRVASGTITSACMLVEPDVRHRKDRHSHAQHWLAQWHEKQSEMPSSEEELCSGLVRIAEEIRAREEAWEMEKAQRKLKDEAFWSYKTEFWSKFQLPDQRREDHPVKVRSDQKSKAIMKHVGFQPTSEDLRYGNILSKVIDDLGNIVRAAFVKTRKGSLVCGVLLSQSEYTGDLEHWADTTVYAENKTPEEAAQEEKYRQAKEDSKLEKAELEKMKMEFPRAHQSPRPQKAKAPEPDGFSKAIDSLVDRAVSDTNE